jgi:ElaB/YqjD/DUF883 family membrane-anchored ribosome-binding protein
MQSGSFTLEDGHRESGELEDRRAPVRNGLEEAARELGEALTKAGQAIRKLREIDLSELTARSPVVALSVAAGIGMMAGVWLLARRR